jgi:uncharacterized OB-fold protein
MGRTVIPAEVFDPHTNRLMGSRCSRCTAVHFPPIDGCPDCFAAATDRVPLAQDGRVRSLTTVDLGFPGFPPGYTVAEVEFPEGVVVLGPLASVDGGAPIEIGMTVTVDSGPIRIDDQGESLDGYRFVPGGLR